MTVVLTGFDLTLDQLVQVAREGEQVALAPEARERMAEARGLVDRVLERGDEVYGLTTGVGMRKRFRVPLEDMAAFNRRLIDNHRVGQGPPAAHDVVRAALLCLANGFARGTAAVRIELAERAVAALNDDQRLEVRSLGSVGQSDLPAMADLAHGLTQDLELGAREGLALLNSGAFSTALAALAVHEALRLADTLDVAAALDLEAFAANVTPLHVEVGVTRPYPGVVATIERLRRLLEGSYLWQEGVARNLQDPLTFRNVPQLHGALRDSLDFVQRQLAIELNASQDNPLPVLEEDRFISVANYELLPLAASLDFLRIVLASALSAAAERSIKLLQAPLTDLPEGLAPSSGLVENSLSEFGVPAQSIASEARLLASPVSFELVSTTHAEGIEDRSTMAPLAARRLAEQVELGERLVAIELVLAAQAVDLRGRRSLGTGTGRAYELVRERISFMGEGDPVPPDLEPVRELVRSGLTLQQLVTK